jgi:hypothetical protein
MSVRSARFAVEEGDPVTVGGGVCCGAWSTTGRRGAPGLPLALDSGLVGPGEQAAMLSARRSVPA